MGDESDPEALLKLLRRLCDGNEFVHKAEFVKSVLWCLRAIAKQENDEAVENAAKMFLQLYDRSITLIQNQLIQGLVTYDSPFLTLLLSNRSLSTCSSFPRHLLLDTFFTTNLTARLRESYVMCIGTNSSFNLGVASDGEVKDPRVVAIPEKILKVSMSNTHTLFLTQSGTVYGCGKGTNGQLGPDLKKLVVEPVLLNIGQGKQSIVDMVASEKYSVFITSKSVFVCGEVCHSSIGSTVDRPIRRFDDLDVTGNANFNAVSASPERVIVSNNVFDWLAGADLCSRSVHSCFTCMKGELALLVKLPDRNFSFNSGVTNLRSTPQIIFGSTKFVAHSTSSSVQRFVKTRNSRLVRFPWGRWDGPPTVTAELTLRTELPVEFQPVGSLGIVRSVFNCPGLPESNCLFSVNGSLIRLNVVQFDTTSDGDVVLLAFSLEDRDSRIPTLPRDLQELENFTDIHNILLKHNAGACLYRGKATLVADSSREDDFELCAASQDMKMFYRMRVVLQLEEIPGTHSVRQFSMSPDGKNLIYLVDNDEMTVQAFSCVVSSGRSVGVPIYDFAQEAIGEIRGTKFHHRWAVLDIPQLNSERELNGYEPIALDLHVRSNGPTPVNSSMNKETLDLFKMFPSEILEERSFHTVPEFAMARFPQSHKFIDENNVFVKEKIPLPAFATSLILDYMEGKDHFNPYNHFYGHQILMKIGGTKDFVKTWANIFAVTKRALDSVGLDLIYENYDLWRVRSSLAHCSVEILPKDVNIQAMDGEIITFNRSLLTLQSNYFEVALLHKREDEALKMDFPSNIVQSALRVLIDPMHLYDIEYPQILHLLHLFDQYIFEAAIDDCLWVLVDRANEFNIPLFFDCYRNLDHFRDALVDLLFNRLHLVCFWRTSSSAPLEMLRMLSARLVPATFRRFSLNGVAKGGCLVHGEPYKEPLEANWSFITKEDLQKMMLGENPDEGTLKHLDLLYKKAEQSRRDELSDRDPLLGPLFQEDECHFERPHLITQILKGKHPRARRASENAREAVPVVSSPMKENKVLVEEKVAEDMESNLGGENARDEEEKRSAEDAQVNAPEPPLSPELEPCSPPINRWGVSQTPLAAGDSLFHIEEETPKKRGEKFIAKGKKFKKVEMTTQKASVAPWLAASTSTASAPVSLKDIQREEQETVKSAPRDIPKTPRTRKNTWNGEPSPSPQQAPVSLARIMAEEAIMNAPVTRSSRPLEFVEAEERAVLELSRLYEEQYKEMAMVTVEVVSSVQTDARWGGGRRR